MNVTKHARERWIERAKPESTDQAEEQVIEAFEKSFFVCRVYMTCLGRGDGTPLTWALSEPEMDEGVNDPRIP